MYDTIESTVDLPVGSHRSPGPGVVRARSTQRRSSLRLCGRATLMEVLPGPTARRAVGSRARQMATIVERPQPEPPHYAFFGVRPCELAAIEYSGSHSAGSRDAMRIRTMERGERNALIVAINCDEPGELCFCVSMDTGPRAEGGYDIALTEVSTDIRSAGIWPNRARNEGEELLARLLGCRGGHQRDRSARRRGHGSGPPTDGPAAWTRPTVKELLQSQPDHPGVDGAWRPLPGMHQLHARVSDLLLLVRRGRHIARRHIRVPGPVAGTRVSPSISHTSTVVRCGSRLPPATGNG